MSNALEMLDENYHAILDQMIAALADVDLADSTAVNETCGQVLLDHVGEYSSGVEFPNCETPGDYATQYLRVARDDIERYIDGQPHPDWQALDLDCHELTHGDYYAVVEAEPDGDEWGWSLRIVVKEGVLACGTAATLLDAQVAVEDLISDDVTIRELRRELELEVIRRHLRGIAVCLREGGISYETLLDELKQMGGAQ